MYVLWMLVVLVCLSNTAVVMRGETAASEVAFPLSKPTVSPLLTPVASRNLLLYQSLPTSIPDRHAIPRRRKDDTRVGPTARSIVA
jgi:hypothetical protein